MCWRQLLLAHYSWLLNFKILPAVAKQLLLKLSYISLQRVMKPNVVHFSENNLHKGKKQFFLHGIAKSQTWLNNWTELRKHFIRSHIRLNDNKFKNVISNYDVIPFFKSWPNCNHRLATRVQQKSIKASWENELAIWTWQ